jgi:glutamate-1-semialdehyde 2,1-aminomutase
MSCMFFTDEDVRDWTTASTSDTEAYAAFFRGMLERGFILAPSQFEAAFVGLAHTDDDIDAALASASEVLAAL